LISRLVAPKKSLSQEGNEPLYFSRLCADIAAENSLKSAKVVSKLVSKKIEKRAHQLRAILVIK